MNWKAIIKNLLLGPDLPNEYVCVSENSIKDRLNISLKINNKKYNVDNSHVFLGYKPLLWGLFFGTESDLSKQIRSLPTIELSFTFTDTGRKAKPGEVARLHLKKLKEIPLRENAFFLFEGTYGTHHFLNWFHRVTHFVRESLQSRKPGNVDLPPNLYDQVRIAYSVPRNISVISVGVEGKYNLFPTDLHGPVGERFYVSSLRYGGKACQQVEEQKRLVISGLETRYYKQVYSLGKNHMAEPKPLDQFEIHDAPSEVWHLPLPRGVVNYRELSWIKSMDVGIHRIHFYESGIQKVILPEAESLSHVHQYYAKWRIANGLKTEWFFR